MACSVVALRSSMHLICRKQDIRWSGDGTGNTSPEGQADLRRSRAWRCRLAPWISKPGLQPGGNVDIEALARNAARMIEEGGKALAAYIKPREDGKLQDQNAEGITDVVRTLGHVLEYWLADPQRADRDAKSARQVVIWSCGPSPPSALPASKPTRWLRPIPKDKRFADPEWTSNQFYDFIKQAYLLTTEWANVSRHATRTASIRIRGTRRSFISARLPTRCRRRTSLSPIPKCCARRWRPTRKISSAACKILRPISRPAAAI